MATNHDQDGSEEVAFRPPNVQTKTLLDIGTRSMFTPEQDMFRESVRKFMTDTLAPQQVREGREGQLYLMPRNPLRRRVSRPGSPGWPWGPRCQQSSTLLSPVTPQGLIGVSTPAEVGGIGGTFIDEMIVCEEMSYRCCIHTTGDPGKAVDFEGSNAPAC